MSPTILSADAAHHLIESGQAVLVDVRAADEHARECIPGALHVPLALWQAGDARCGAALAGVPAVVFHCRSGHRTRAAAAALAAGAACDAYLLDGGLDAWKRAGLPVRRDASQPLELQRQVHLAAGALVALGTLLAATVSPWFLAVPALVGCGLMVAGATGFCGMARLLARMPWNRPQPA